MTTMVLDPSQTASLRIEAWNDPLVDRLGHDPRSHYVETYWLPVLGPSTTWLLRRIAAGLEAAPDGFDIDLEETARSLGLGVGAGERMRRQSPFLRTLGRCIDFEMAQLRRAKTLAVRRKLPPLSRRHLVRLSPALQEQHESYLADRPQTATIDHLRSHGRLLAASLAEIGEDQAATELQLMRWSFHPALARECAAWAHEQHMAAGSAGRGTSSH